MPAFFLSYWVSKHPLFIFSISIHLVLFFLYITHSMRFVIPLWTKGVIKECHGLLTNKNIKQQYLFGIIMNIMTRLNLKHMAMHPYLTSLAAIRSFGTREALGDSFTSYRAVHSFMRSNGFTLSERMKVRSLMARAEFCALVNEPEGTEFKPRSLLIVASIKGKEVSYFTVRAKKTTEFPDRIDEQARTSHIEVATMYELHASYFLSLFKGVAARFAESDSGLDAFFKQPCFG